MFDNNVLLFPFSRQERGGSAPNCSLLHQEPNCTWISPEEQYFK